MINPTEEDIGKVVIYTPNHANDDLSHPDNEKGPISSISDSYVFVRYHDGDTAAATLRENLHWAGR